MLKVVTSSFYTQSETMTPLLSCNCNDMGWVTVAHSVNSHKPIFYFRLECRSLLIDSKQIAFVLNFQLTLYLYFVLFVNH